jgi:23S rRNA pseudouridine1911/1915/1917 synthase
VVSTIRSCAEVPPELVGQRVDKVAAELFEDFSRVLLSQWIASGALTVDGARLKPKTRLKGGELLELDATMEPREDWGTAQRIAFDVIYEDDDLLIVNKPAGLVVHPGAGNRDRTLVNGLLHHRPSLSLLPRAGIVHRLDKDTSGLLVVAATPASHTRLIRTLQQRLIERRYLAVTEGRMITGCDIDQPIGRDRRLRTRQQIREDGKAALTRVRVRERFRLHSLVEAELATGRTHQIRVHLSAIGFPLVGDRRYGARGKLPPAAAEDLVGVLRGFSRQALHAYRLGFEHPRSGKRIDFEAQFPADMRALVRALQLDRDAHPDPQSMTTDG